MEQGCSMENLQLFFSHYKKLYDKNIEAHFPHIQHLLQIIPAELKTVLYLLIGDETKGGHIWKYISFVRTSLQKMNFIFLPIQITPLSEKKFTIEDKWKCIINGPPLSYYSKACTNIRIYV